MDLFKSPKSSTHQGRAAPQSTPPCQGETPSTESMPPKQMTLERSPSPSAVYRVYLVEDFGSPNHESIFVETNEPNAKDGMVFHVTGTILNGMTYESKGRQDPESFATFVLKKDIGVIKTDLYQMIDEICRGITPPGKQMKLNGHPIDRSKPLYRCGEWAKDAISALRQAGILK